MWGPEVNQKTVIEGQPNLIENHQVAVRPIEPAFPLIFPKERRVRLYETTVRKAAGVKEH